MSKDKIYCGFVAIIGSPNVGKSTLLNKLLGKKISITSHKPHTTRHRIIGIETESNYQTIYIDTPGLHIEEKRTINRFMNRTANNLIYNTELIIFVTEGIRWTINDEMVINKLRHLSAQVLLVINKIDNLANKTSLFPHIEFLSKQMNFLNIVPISAKKGFGIDIITKIIHQNMPEGPHHFPADWNTNSSKDFIASEIIREKLMRFLGDELPYSVTVKINQFSVTKSGSYDINGLIFVERFSQKKMVIGNKGSKIKKIGIEARIDMEKFFVTKVRLKLWVKIQAGWPDDKFILNKLGYRYPSC
ncbi:MAG: GTPase Era [Arsenophonus sp.]